MTSVNSTTAVPTITHPSSPLPQVEAEWKPSFTTSRSSLDVPRTKSPWELPDGGRASPRPSSPLPKVPPKPGTTTRDPNLVLRQRPLSMVHSSPPPRPPVKLRSRNPSPSKLAQQIVQGAANEPPSPHTVPSGGPSLPSNNTSKHIESERPPIGTEAGPVVNIPPPIADSGIRKDISVPSVNRSEKPKPPSKPPMAHGVLGKPNLDSSQTESWESQSLSFKSSHCASDDQSIGNYGKPSDFKESTPRVQQPLPILKSQPSKERNQEIKGLHNSNSRKSLQETAARAKTIDEGRRPGLPPRPIQGSPSSVPRENNDIREQPHVNTKPSSSQSSVPTNQALKRHIPRPSRNIGTQDPQLLSTSQPLQPDSYSPLLRLPDKSTADLSSHLNADIHVTARGESPSGGTSADYPDTSRSNRKPPKAHKCASAIETKYDTRLFDVCGKYICATGYLTRAWDVTTGELVFHKTHNEKEAKVTAIAFKSGGAAEDEGKRLWLGTNYGELYEVDIPDQEVVQRMPAAHMHREIIKLYRYENYMWSLDDDGRFHVWPPDKTGSPNLSNSPQIQRLPRGHTFSVVVNGHLWLATGKDIRIYNPSQIAEPSFQVTASSFSQPNAGEITSGAVVSSQIDRLFFGHTDGKITAYSIRDHTCLGVYNVSNYKINCMAGAGSYLWAGFNTGMIYVYDTRRQPWLVKKDWMAHENPVSAMLSDRTSVLKFNRLNVASLGMDNVIRVWDGLLEEDWLGRPPMTDMAQGKADIDPEEEMQSNEAVYCNFREIRSVVVSWNAGATTPSHLRGDDNFFRKVINPGDPPDILVFGFQELVDLDDKKLTASKPTSPFLT